jgi:integrase
MRAAKVTFATMVPLFLERKKMLGQLKPNTHRKWNRSLTDYYFKPLHHLPIDEITTEQIQTRIDLVAGQSGNSAAVDCCTAMRVFFGWANKTGKFPDGHHNPMDNVQAPAKNPSRKRVLTDDEIRLIWKTCDTWEAQAIQEHQFKQATGKMPHLGALNDPDAPRAVKLVFLTGCRRQEIGGLRWPEVEPLDDAELVIPGSRRKSRKSKEDSQILCVPLADMAVQILRGIEKRPNNDQVFGRDLKRGRRKTPGLDLQNAHKRINRWITKAGGTPPPNWVVHDIRRTFRTRLAALGVTKDVAEALVGHVGHRTEMDSVYNHHEYWPEKKQALAMWEANLRAIIDGTAEKIAHPRFGERQKGRTT